MAKISEDCIDEALANLRNFGKDELEQYVRDVLNRANSYDDLRGASALARAESEINEEKFKGLFQQTAQKAKNILAFERSAKLIRDGKLDFRSLLYNARESYLKKAKLYGTNISSAQKAELEDVFRYLFDDLTHDDVAKLSGGKFDDAIADAYDGKISEDPFVNRIAQKLKSYMQDRTTRLITSGAMMPEEMNEDRSLQAIHEGEKVAGGRKSLIKLARDWRKPKDAPFASREAWKRYILTQLDMHKTFSKTNAIDVNGQIDMGQVDKILNRIYDNITTNKSEIFTKSSVVNDRDAIKNKSKMFFVWRGMRSQLEYNKQYGQGGLFDMLMRDARASANRSGLARFWGDNPVSVYNDLRHVQQEVNPKSSKYWEHNDKVFDLLTKGNKLSVWPALSNFVDNVKQLSSMARLTLLSLDSISDVGYQASFAQRMGINYYRAYTNQLQHLFDAMPTEERTRIARLMKTQVDSQLGYMGRWVNESNPSSMLNKISTAYFKKIGLEAFDRGGRVGIMHMMAKHLFENSSKSFDALEPALQKWVGKFLTKDEWDLLRKNNQGKLFTTDNVDTLTDAQLREHYQSTDKLIPLADTRYDLYRKVHSMFSVSAENAVLSPSEFEKAWLTGERGTVKGELWNLFTQFKAYPLAYIDRVLVQGFQDSDGATQKLKWASSLLMGTLPLSYLSVWLHNLANGLTNPDWDEMNFNQRKNYLVNMVSPSLGIFMGLLDPKNQNAGLLTSFLSSPSTRFLSNAVSSVLALQDGDLKASGKAAKNALDYMMPIQTVPFITPFIREIMGDHATLQPGQNVIYGQ